MTTTARRARRRDERGGALVEFALVAPLLLTLRLGVVDFSLVMYNGSTLRQGTRAGARAAAVARYGTDTTCTVTGTTPPTEVRKLLCTAKDAIDLPEADVRMRLLFSAGGDTANETVVVCAQYQARSASGLFSSVLNSRVMQSRVAMRVEQTGTLSSYAETALKADGWTSCAL